MSRPTIDATMMLTAFVWSDMSTCSRLSVGAVLAMGRHVAAIGYNGAPAGLPHCDHSRDLAEPGCTAAVHAERNAINDAAARGVAVRGATLYSTHAPCRGCAGDLINVGVSRVVYALDYRDRSGLLRLADRGIPVEHMAEFSAP